MPSQSSIPTNLISTIDLPSLAGDRLTQLPFSLRVLLENALRHQRHDPAAADAVNQILHWDPQASQRNSIPFYPARILLQDLTGVPLIVDLTAMRSAYQRLGGDPAAISPRIPVDLVIDHSLQVDFTGVPDAFARNQALDYERNRERYELLRWAQDAFDNFRVVPPGKGIVHQINLEYLANVITQGPAGAFPDTVLGTDSHTPMINGLGVLGWGVGGIEAIAAMLGHPVDLVLPDVVGLELVGELQRGVTPTDLTLTIVERLRQGGVVGKFIECFGEGMKSLPVADRAMIANMSPESGSTVTYFPIDRETITYLQITGRSPEQIALVEATSKAQGLYRNDDTPTPQFTRTVRINLADIVPSLAGPTRPQDRLSITNLKPAFKQHLSAQLQKNDALTENTQVEVTIQQEKVRLTHGSLLIAAITSCTNTSNPTVMLSASLMAKKALACGLRPNPAVKCSLMPGSRVVTAYLEQAGLLVPLAALGFDLVGYGCGSCIGNSGPLAPEIVRALQDQPLVTASISSGNRNFEGRIHALSRANYLTSPPLVIAYALAGTVNIDLNAEPLGMDQEGAPVYLRDLQPTPDEVKALQKLVQPDLFKRYGDSLFEGDDIWQSINAGTSSVLFPWKADSTYVQEPPYLQNFFTQKTVTPTQDLEGARVLALLGDSITTDHISPAGSIPSNSSAGKYLSELGIPEALFNTYGARRGNDRVMARGTFANLRLRNALAPSREGGFTRHLPDGAEMTIYDAAQFYHKEGVPLIILAGKEYGTGSSRDWAAKGPLLLGVRAMIAQSYERIHRANLVGMGILPLTFLPSQSAQTLGLTGEETYNIFGLSALSPLGQVDVHVNKRDGRTITFQTTAQLFSPAEVRRYQVGGILQEALFEVDGTYRGR